MGCFNIGGMKLESFITNYFPDESLNICAEQLKNSQIDLNSTESAEEIANAIYRRISFIRLANTDEVYLYNAKGYYERAEKWLLQVLIKLVLNFAGAKWNTRIEKEILGAMYRDCTNVISGFNTENAVNFEN